MTGTVRDRSIDRLVWWITGAVGAVFWLVATSWRPWNLFERGFFSSDFYDEQARSFLRLRLAVRPEVAGQEGFVIGDDTFLYYGPFLAIVRLPFAVLNELTDEWFAGRLVIVSMLIALAVLGRWSLRLARAGRRVVAGRVDDEPSDRWPVAVFASAVLVSPAFFAAGWITVYHETELWAFTLAIVSITLLVEWAAGGFRDRRLLAWAAAAVMATTLTRVPIGLGLAFALGLAGLFLLFRSRRSSGESPDGWWAVGAAVAPLVVHVVVNVAKFGSLFSVPGDKQLLTFRSPARAAFFETTGGSFFSLSFLPTTVVQYLRPDTIRFERFVPFIRFGPLAENRGSIDVETVTPASSLVVSATLLLLLAVVGVVWALRHRARFWLLLVLGGTIGALPSFLIGFVANRYLIDMLPPLAILAALAVWSLPWDRRRWLRVGGVVLVVWGLWVNVALATWWHELLSPGFTELRSDVDALIFGDGDIGIVDFDPERVPRDGIVGLTASCDAVYMAEQGVWVAIESSDDGSPTPLCEKLDSRR